MSAAARAGGGRPGAGHSLFWTIGWCLAVVGLSIMVMSPVYAHRRSQQLHAAWLQREALPEPGNMSAAEFDARIRRGSQRLLMLANRERPAWTRVSPWALVPYGAGTLCLGVVLLAVDRFRRR